MTVVLFLAVRLVGAALISTASASVAPFLDAAAVLLSGLLPFCLFRRRLTPDDPTVTLMPPQREHLSYLLLLPLFIVSVSLLASTLTYIGSLMGYENAILLPSSRLRLVVSAAVLPSLVEELVCRYLCLVPFASGRGTSAVWISAILFALLHADPVQIPYALFAGLILGALAVQTKSIWIPMLFHLANNLTSVAFFLLGDGVGANLLEGSLLALAALSIPFALRPRTKESPGPLASIWRTLRPDASDAKRILDLLLSPLMIPVLLCLWLTAITALS